MWLLHLNTSFWILRGMLWNIQLRDKAFLINKYRYLLHFRKNLVYADFDLWRYQADLQEKVHSFLYMSGYIFILFKLLSKRKKMQVEESPQISRNWNVVKSWQSQFSLSSIQGRCVEIPHCSQDYSDFIWVACRFLVTAL